MEPARFRHGDSQTGATCEVIWQVGSVWVMSDRYGPVFTNKFLVVSQRKKIILSIGLLENCLNVDFAIYLLIKK